MTRNLLMTGVLAMLIGCGPPPKPVLAPGEFGLALDFTSANQGSCVLTGPGVQAETRTILNGDYITARGNLLQSVLRCDLADGRRVVTTSHHQLFDLGPHTYSGLIVNPVLGPGEVAVFGYSEGPDGKVDTQGTLVFVEG